MILWHPSEIEYLIENEKGVPTQVVVMTTGSQTKLTIYCGVEY